MGKSAEDYISGGWGSEPEVRKQSREETLAAALEQWRRDKAFLDTFSAGPGRQVLAELRNLTIEQPCFDPEAGQNAAYVGFMREGQNSVVREIERRMEAARSGPPTGAQEG